MLSLYMYMCISACVQVHFEREKCVKAILNAINTLSLDTIVTRRKRKEKALSQTIELTMSID